MFYMYYKLVKKTNLFLIYEPVSPAKSFFFYGQVPEVPKMMATTASVI
jgi:hypothetical protein